jgi:hypothetical protein
MAAQGRDEWRASVALFTAGEVALLKEAAVPGGLVVRVQALTALHQGAASQPEAGTGMEGGAAAAGVVAGHAVPGQAWVCLGKMCLADEAMAKKCLPLFVQVRYICQSCWNNDSNRFYA